MMKKIFTVLSVAVLVGVASPSMARGDMAKGAESAKACVGCHGEKGVSVVPTFPILAGQHANYIVKALNQYKTGARKNPIMVGTVAGLNDDDIDNLALYFSTQKSGVHVVPPAK